MRDRLIFRSPCGLGTMLLALALQFPALPAHACSCLPTEPEDFINKSAAILHGEVISVEPVDKNYQPTPGLFTSSGPTMRAIFRVNRVYKGNLGEGEMVEVRYEQSSGSNCGTSFSAGNSGLFSMAHSAAGYLGTSACQRVFSNHPRDAYRQALDAYLKKEEDLRKSALAQPRSEFALRRFSEFLVQTRQPERAEKVLDEWIAINPRSARALMGKADLAFSSKRFESALEIYRKVLEIEPRREARNGIANSLFWLQRLDEIKEGERDFSGLNSWGLDAQFRGRALDNADFTSAQLRSADFSEASLVGSSFSRAALYEATFTRSKLQNVDFTYASGRHKTSFQAADLRGARFEGSNFFTTDFSGADVAGADFRRAGLESTNFKGAKFQGTQFRAANLTNADLSSTEWTTSDLSRATLLGANLHGARLGKTNLDGAKFGFTHGGTTDLRGADLSEVNATDVLWGTVIIDCHTRLPERIDVTTLNAFPVWTGCASEPPRTMLKGGFPRQSGPRFAGMEADRVKFQNYALSGLSFVRMKMHESQWQGSDLRDLWMADSDLRGANFDGADLSGAFLTRVNLNGASFNRTNLSNVRFSGVQLEQADLEGSRLDGACYDKTTTWPLSFRPDVAGMKSC